MKRRAFLSAIPALAALPFVKAEAEPVSIEAGIAAGLKAHFGCEEAGQCVGAELYCPPPPGHSRRYARIQIDGDDNNIQYWWMQWTLQPRYFLAKDYAVPVVYYKLEEPIT